MIIEREKDATNGRRRERGAVLVEVTMIVLPLTVLFLGMIELAALWKADSQVSAAARQGARATSHLGNDPQSDRSAVRAVVAALDGDDTNILSIVVYDADAISDPSSCVGASGQRCNLFDDQAIDLLEVDGRWGCAAGGAFDRNWCPTSRSQQQADLDTIGVHVVYRHEYRTGFFGVSQREVAETSVMRLEPREG